MYLFRTAIITSRNLQNGKKSRIRNFFYAPLPQIFYSDRRILILVARNRLEWQLRLELPMLNKYALIFALLLQWGISSNDACAQVVINEMSNANLSTLVSGNNDTEDWIELYNTGTSAVNLQNYALTDNPQGSARWKFPSCVLQPNAFLVVLASGKNITSTGYIHTDFKLSLKEQTIALYDPAGNVIDNCTRSQRLHANHSFGRRTDGASEWGYFNTPTPKASNNTAQAYNGYEPAPVFSVKGGFFNGLQSVTITGSPTAVVRYTLNGSVPTTFSNVASAPVPVSKTTVVSAQAFSNGNLLPSDIVKNTYFISEQLGLPIFSITTDSTNLWDYNEGIYVNGPNADTAYPHYGANYWKDIEKQAYVEYFDKQQVKKFESGVGLKIFGGYSRVFPQKSFKLKFRAPYGSTQIPYSLINDRSNVRSYRDVILRNGGSDFIGTHFRDAFMHRLMKNEHIDYMAYEPSVVFLNGDFWGFYEIRERQDERYLEMTHNVPVEKMDFLSHEGAIWTFAGSDTGFFNMHSFIVNGNPQSDSYYPSVTNMLDVNNFVDYFIAETYYGNADWVGEWENNIKLWRPHGGKWRYIMWDVDWGMGLFHSPSKDFLSIARHPNHPNPHSEMFNSLLGNTEFRNYFVNRYADLINTVYKQENIQSMLYQMRDEVAPIMERHFGKFGGSLIQWHSSIQSVLTFNESRMNIVRDQVQQMFQLPAQVDVELDVQPAGAGKIKISTVIPDQLPWKGVYFNGVPVTITAIPNPGYTFKHWQSQHIVTSPEAKESMTVDISTNDKFTAYFEERNEMEVYPNPCREDVTVYFNLPEEEQVSVKLYSAIGQEVMDIIPYSFMAKGDHTINVNLETSGVVPGVYFVQMKIRDQIQTIKIVRK